MVHVIVLVESQGNTSRPFCIKHLRNVQNAKAKKNQGVHVICTEPRTHRSNDVNRLKKHRIKKSVCD